MLLLFKLFKLQPADAEMFFDRDSEKPVRKV